MKTIRRKFFWTQMIIIVTLSLLLGVAGTVMNLYSEMNKRDQNLQNAAEAVSYSMNLTGSELNREDISPETSDYLDTFKNVMDDIDVISVVNSEGVRVYHSNHSLIGTAYEGSWPYFGEKNGNQYYAVNETGPSGPQRRAYAAVYTQEGQYAGFVMAIMLMDHIYTEIYRTVMLYIGVTFAAVVVELLIMAWLFSRLNRSLMGYEPDTFTAMYKMRDNILEALEEGIVAADVDGNIQFTNLAADEMLKHKANMPVADVRQIIVRQILQILSVQLVSTGGGHIQTADDVHQRGLSGAGRAHDGQIISLFHGQIDVFQHPDRSPALLIILTDVCKLQNRHHSTPPSAGGSVSAVTGCSRVVETPSRQASSGKAR